MTVLYLRARMVGVAQLVELRLVMPAVVGSSPIVHPIQLFDLINFFVVRLMAAHIWHTLAGDFSQSSPKLRPVPRLHQRR